MIDVIPPEPGAKSSKNQFKRLPFSKTHLVSARLGGPKKGLPLVSYVLEFERFRLYPQQRLLLENNTIIDVPGRAMDVLIVLAERAGEVIANVELIANAWPGAFVQDGNLRVQINTLRRVLRDGCDGVQFISNVPKRG